MKYLRLRGKKYQFERPVPKDLQAMVGLVSWRESLQTDSKIEAEMLCRRRSVETDEIINAARDGSLRLISDEDLDDMAIHWSLQFQDAHRENIPRDMFPDVFKDEPNIRGNAPSTLFATRSALEANVKDWVTTESKDILPNSTDWSALVDRCLDEYLTANPEISDQWVTILSEQGFDPSTRQKGAFKVVQRSKRINSKAKISSVFKQYVAGSDLGKSAATDFAVGIRRYHELHGDMDINDVSRRHAEDFRDALRQMPSRPPNDIRSKPFTEQISWAQGLDTKLLSNSAINKNLMAAKLTLQYGFEQTSLIEDRNWRNPFDGFLKKPKAGPNSIKGFTPEQLELVFSPVAFKPTKAEQFWIPIILYYTGARLDEISQLHVTDIRLDPVPHILAENLYDENAAMAKKVKNLSSNRTIPIHRVLLELGLFAYRDRIKKLGHKHLFPDLPHSNGGKRGNAVSRNFIRGFREYGAANAESELDTKSLVTHSLRHSFRSSAFRKLEQDFVQVVMGHYVGGVSFQTYGEGIYHMPDILAERVMDKIQLAPLDQTHLRKLADHFLDDLRP